MNVNCKQCNKEIRLTLGQIKQGRICCSRICSANYKWSSPTFRKKMSEVHMGKPSGKKGFKVSEETKIKISNSLKGIAPWNIGKKGLPSGKKGKKYPNLQGENNYRWIKDRTKVARLEDRRNAEYHQWHRAVLVRDSYKCKILNKDCDGKLEVHHILGWKDHPELRYEVNNGITLCHYHHPRKRVEEARLSPYFQEIINSNIN